MKILDFPSLAQTYGYDCGANVLRAVLFFYGLDSREDKIIKLAGACRRGTPAKRIKKLGLKYQAEKMTIKIVHMN
jgi:ABC-type bacteriocin/lantibiotic exporter with double-glycine peptidase domain